MRTKQTSRNSFSPSEVKPGRLGAVAQNMTRLERMNENLPTSREKVLTAVIDATNSEEDGLKLGLKGFDEFHVETSWKRFFRGGNDWTRLVTNIHDVEGSTYRLQTE